MRRTSKATSRVSTEGRPSSDCRAACTRSAWAGTAAGSRVLMAMTAKTTLSASSRTGMSHLRPTSGAKCCCLGRLGITVMTIYLKHSTDKTTKKDTAKNTASAQKKMTMTNPAIWATSSTAPSWRSAGIWLLPPTTGWCISSKKTAAGMTATIV
ncbi:Uncharacterised protein [Neisseria meningitidis]|nr:Uncharacterised protein [Neisseria meningitidis]